MKLLRWYHRHRRDLPWRRRESDAYAQLLAEFMLQQTQVATVVGYFERFIARFPTVASLAEAQVDEVLTIWSGLGYYSRARNLHATAVKLMADHDGVVPRSVETLTTLPGVGRYTAGAIASVAYGVRAPVVDGNVARVLMRLLAIDADPKLPAVRDRLWSVAESILPAKRCGAFNQALMELGATVCSPRTPHCLSCPLQQDCLAFRESLTDRIPPPAKRTRVRQAEVVVLSLRHGSSLLFTQRPPTGLWAGLWELPTEEIGDGESNQDALRRLQTGLLGKSRRASKPLGTVTRQLTHRRVTFHVYELPIVKRPALSRGESEILMRWLTAKDLPSLGISRACEAVLGLLGWSRDS